MRPEWQRLVRSLRYGTLSPVGFFERIAPHITEENVDQIIEGIGGAEAKAARSVVGCVMVYRSGSPWQSSNFPSGGQIMSSEFSRGAELLKTRLLVRNDEWITTGIEEWRAAKEWERQQDRQEKGSH